MGLEAPRSQYRQVADLLRSGIESGEYASGSPLPSEPDLASRFGVSRVTINRAVQLLRGEGLVKVLDSLPQIIVEAEQLLAALLVRLPLADPDGIWTSSKHHVPQAADSPDANSHFLIGDGSSWHYRWNGTIQAFDIAAALTDTITGLAGTTAVLRPRQPLTRQLRRGETEPAR